jgi:protochlorophyllide reductase
MRTAVVTGATQGLGRHAAASIAATPGWRVVLAVRDVVRGAAVAAELGPGTDVVALDLADLASVRAAAREIADRHASLDALVLNAGIQVARTGPRTQDGFELTFGVNHLGHVLLAGLLRPGLAPAARIAVVSSGTHFGTVRKSGPYPAPRWRDPRELARPADGASGQVAYATSKLANVLFAREAARRWAPVAVNAYDPGLMPGTGLARDYPPAVRGLYARLEPLLVRLLPGATRPERSGPELARLVTDPAYDGLTGAYVEIDHVTEPSPAAQDEARAAELWRVSEELVGLGTPADARAA